MSRLAVAATLLLMACGGASAAPTLAVSPTADAPATFSEPADQAETRRFLTRLAQGAADGTGPLLIDIKLWRQLCATDMALAKIGVRVDAMITGPDGQPQLDSNGDPKTVEVAHVLVDDARTALAASSATHRFASRVTGGKFREATPAERQLVLDRTPSDIPTNAPIVVVDAPPSTVAFLLLDGHVFWMDDLAARGTANSEP